MVYHSIFNKLQRRRSTSLNVLLLCSVCKYIHESNQNYHRRLLLLPMKRPSWLLLVHIRIVVVVVVVFVVRPRSRPRLGLK